MEERHCGPRPIEDLGKNIWIADKYCRLYLKTAFGQDDLNLAEGLTLMVLYGGDSISQDAIIQELHLDKGVMTRTIKGLKDKGYVHKVKDPEDSRASLIKLSDQGRGYRERMGQVLRGWNEVILADISEEDLEVANRVLVQIKDRALGWLGKN